MARPPERPLRRVLGWAGWLLGSALVVPGGAHGAEPKTVHWRCEAVYQPARAVWVRTLRIGFDDRRVRSVSVDGVPVHTFTVAGTTILTSLDNERIQFDPAHALWTSDFRGQAQAQGACERLD